MFSGRVTKSCLQLLNVCYLLVSRKAGAVRRDQLMDSAYEGAVHVSNRTIDGHIRNIRRKFTEVDDKVDLIGTVQELS